MADELAAVLVASGSTDTDLTLVERARAWLAARDDAESSLRELERERDAAADRIGLLAPDVEAAKADAEQHAAAARTARRQVEVLEAEMVNRMRPAADPGAGILSLGYETATNTRGLVFIEADHKKLGTVVVMPIGITEISSVRFSVEQGQHVDKGDELGYFSYGGSTLAVVFQPGAIRKFTTKNPHGKEPDNGPPIDVNAEIAIAR